MDFTLDLTGTVLLVVATLAAAVALAWLLFRPRWMGLRDKTMWDWISLLAVPSMVSLATLLLTQNAARLERDRQVEFAIQGYFDRMTDLALNPRDEASEGAVAAAVRAQTMAILQMASGERAGRVLSFLQEIEMLDRLGSGLEGLDLSEAELKDMSLEGADLESSDLRHADLEETDLSDADMERTDLRRADLKGADLSGADLNGARMDDADLDHTDLRGADLTGATGLTEAQVSEACMDAGTVLPAGLTAPSGETEACSTPFVEEDEDEDDDLDDD